METNTDMLRGRVDIFVLKALSIRDGYGYDILNYVHDKTEGHYEMKQSSIYSVLKRLEKQGYVMSYDGDESNGAKRRYYTLTEAGKSLLNTEEKEWEYTRTLLDNLVSDKTFDLMSDTPPFHPSDLRPLTRRATAKTEQTSNADSTEETEVALPEQDEVVTVQDYQDAEIEQINIGTQYTLAEITQKPADAFCEEVYVPTAEPARADIVDDTIPSVPEESTEPTNVVTTPENVQQPVVCEQKQEVAATIVEDNTAVLPLPTTEAPSSVQSEPTIYEKIAMSPNTFEKTTVRGDKYREFFGDLFERKTDNVAEQPEKVDIDCSHINDLRNHLDKEGIKLRTYEPTNSGKGLIKYILTNKLYRDAFTLSYLFLTAMLLVVYLYKPFGVSLTAFLTILCIAIIAPVVATLAWINGKDRKKKDNFNTKIVLAASGIVYLTFFVINLIINLIIPNGHSLNSPETYAPAIIFLVVPFFGCITTVLYKSKNYHLNTI